MADDEHLKALEAFVRSGEEVERSQERLDSFDRWANLSHWVLGALVAGAVLYATLAGG